MTLPVIFTMARGTRPELGLGVLTVDMSVQPLLVVKGFVTVTALEVSQVLVSITDMPIKNLKLMKDFTFQLHY